jgi:hypothetical protein
MNNIHSRFTYGMLVLLFLLPMPAMAVSVYGTDVDEENLTGSRSRSDGGLKVLDSHLMERVAVSWDIRWNGTFWDYRYDFSGLFLFNKVSYVTFDVSDCFFEQLSSCFIVDDKVNRVPGGERGIIYGDFENIIGAFRTNTRAPGFRPTRFSLIFQSTTAPIWGDLHMEGLLIEAANYWWDDHNDGDSIDGYIPTPGYDRFPPGEIPVPAAIWLFGSGLLGLVGMSRRKASRLT